MIFDEADLLERLAGDADLVAEVVVIFLEDCPLRLQAVESAMARREAVALRAAAHALKGAAGSLGAPRLFEAAQTLEQLAADGSLGSAAVAVQRVGDEARQLVAVLSNRTTASSLPH